MFYFINRLFVRLLLIKVCERDEEIVGFSVFFWVKRFGKIMEKFFKIVGEIIRIG